MKQRIARISTAGPVRLERPARSALQRAGSAAVHAFVAVLATGCSISVNTDPPEVERDDNDLWPREDLPPPPSSGPIPLDEGIYNRWHCSSEPYRDGSGATPGAAGGATANSPEDENGNKPSYQRSSCGAEPPRPGAPCAVPGEQCEYGPVVAADCRQLWVCRDTAWMQMREGCEDMCGSAPGAGERALASCSYPSGEDCSVNNGAYACAKRFNSNGCPTALPFEGSDCTASMEAECYYGLCEATPITARCCGGVWHHSDPQLCAPSFH